MTTLLANVPVFVQKVKLILDFFDSYRSFTRVALFKTTTSCASIDVVDVQWWGGARGFPYIRGQFLVSLLDADQHAQHHHNHHGDDRNQGNGNSYTDCLRTTLSSGSCGTVWRGCGRHCGRYDNRLNTGGGVYRWAVCGSGRVRHLNWLELFI